MEKIGIIGAGFIGQACAQILTQSGYKVMLSNSRDKNTIASFASNIGCEIGSQIEAISFANIILIAIPFANYTSLPADLLSNKIILDTMNYYPDRDGHIEVLDKRQITTSEMVANHLNQSRVVKVFNAILATDILKDAKPDNKENRRAIPIAGDDEPAKQIVVSLLNNIGYDYIDAGGLCDSWKFERAKPAYCIPLNAKDLELALEQACRTKELPHNSWHNIKDTHN